MLAELFRMKVQGFNPLRPIKDGATLNPVLIGIRLKFQSSPPN